MSAVAAEMPSRIRALSSGETRSQPYPVLRSNSGSRYSDWFGTSAIDVIEIEPMIVRSLKSATFSSSA